MLVDGSRLIAVVAVLGLLALAACGSGLDDGSGDDVDVGALTWPTDASTAVVAIDSGGGLPPLEQVPDRFAAVPDAVLYGDGTAVWFEQEAPRTLGLDVDGVRAVLGWAAEAGLLEPGGVATGQPEVYDVGSVSYELTTDAGTTRTVVYAPGFEDEAPGVDGGQRATRARIETFRDRFLDLGASVAPDHVVTPEGPLEVPWEVLTRPAVHVDELGGDEPTWTLDDPAEVGRCRVVTGVDAGRVAEEVGATGEAQIWALDGEPWVLVARPLLPGAPGSCPDRS